MILALHPLLVAAPAAHVAAQEPQSASPLPPGIEARTDIVYASPAGRELRLDVYVPPPQLTPTPAIVFVHGGRPDGRDRTHYRRLAMQVAERGIVAATVDYRQPLEASQPAALDDLRAALAWLDRNAERHGMLPGAIAVAGEDFGGYLAGMLGVAQSDTRRPAAGAVVGIHPILDPTTFIPTGVPAYSYALHLYLRYPLAQRPDLWQAASPLHLVDARSAPFLLAHVEGDRVPVEQSTKMLEALRAAGVRAELFTHTRAADALLAAPHEVPRFAQTLANFVMERLWRAPDGVSVQRDLVYARRGTRELRLDLFLPQGGGGGRPAVLLFHGGGWAWGSKAEMREHAAHLAAQGFVAAAVEYRLTREHVHPAALDDAKEAVRWLRANAAAYDVDPRRIGALGISAGGHLVSMLGVTPARSHFAEAGAHADVSADVRAVVAVSAVVDLPGQDRRDPWSTRILMAGRPDENPAAWRQASPIEHVRPGVASFLFMHGTADPLVSYGEAAAMRERLAAAGVRAEMFTVDGGGHNFFWSHPSRVESMRRATAFLRSALGS